MLLPVEWKRLRDQGRDNYYRQYGVQRDSSIERAAVEAIGSKARRRDLNTRSLRGLEPTSSGSGTTCRRQESSSSRAVAATARPTQQVLALATLLGIHACIPKLSCLLLRICRPGFLLPHESARNYSRINVSFVGRRVCVCVCVCVCMYVRRYTCMHVRMYVRMYACMYICMHVCMHACMDACMYVCMYVRKAGPSTIQMPSNLRVLRK